MPGLIDGGNAPVQCAAGFMRRVLCPRRSRRWPRLRLWSRSLRHCRAGGGGTASQPWQGPSPLPRGTLPPGQPGAKAPGQRPSRPLAGASPPPGRALAFVALGGMVLLWASRRGRGKRSAFPDPARRGGKRSHLGTSSAVLFAGTIAPATRNVAPSPAGGQSLRPAPVPPLGGRFAPAGPGAGLWCSRTRRSTGHRRARAGKRSAFPASARTGDRTSPNCCN